MLFPSHLTSSCHHHVVASCTASLNFLFLSGDELLAMCSEYKLERNRMRRHGLDKSGSGWEPG
jgi:hypothetical protein